MITAGDVISRALRKILVQAGDAPIEADEYADGIDSLNSYMASLEARNIRLGYTPVDNVGDFVTIPDGAQMGIIANFAVLLAPEYAGEVSQALVAEARVGMRSVRLLGQPKVQLRNPAGLPMGSGHAQMPSEDFYGDYLKAHLAMTGNDVATDIEAIDTPYKVAGFWSCFESAGVLCDITGRVRNITKNAFTVTVKYTIHPYIGDTFHVMKNGSSIFEMITSITGLVPSTTDRTESFKVTTTLSPGDYIELYVERDAFTGDYVIENARLEVY
jgi:hypothetical protein